MDSIAIYIHIPYCLKKCPYCDFNSYGIDPAYNRKTTELRERDYVNALVAELGFHSQQPQWQNRNCHSLFFGGGTPSLFSAESIDRIIRAVLLRFSPTQDLEVTIEANPGTIYEDLAVGKLEEFRCSGINRISMGVQSFNDDKLNRLGRVHAAEHVFSSVEVIKKAGFSNFNLDLIFGTPGESIESWLNDLEYGVEQQPQHLSAYNLTIEPGTEFSTQFRKGYLKLPDEERQAELYKYTQEFLSEAGYLQYEISNYAKAEAECRHNLSYWGWQDYLALGAGAHGFYKLDQQEQQRAIRWSNIPGPDQYISRAIAEGDCSQRTEYIDASQAELEYLMLHLRTTRGVNVDQYNCYFENDFETKFSSLIDLFEKDGYLRKQGSSFCFTESGFLFADGLIGSFVEELS